MRAQCRRARSWWLSTSSTRTITYVGHLPLPGRAELVAVAFVAPALADAPACHRDRPVAEGELGAVFPSPPALGEPGRSTQPLHRLAHVLVDERGYHRAPGH